MVLQSESKPFFLQRQLCKVNFYNLAMLFFLSRAFLAACKSIVANTYNAVAPPSPVPRLVHPRKSVKMFSFFVYIPSIHCQKLKSENIQEYCTQCTVYTVYLAAQTNCYTVQFTSEKFKICENFSIFPRYDGK